MGPRTAAHRCVGDDEIYLAQETPIHLGGAVSNLTRVRSRLQNLRYTGRDSLFQRSRLGI